MDWENLVVLLIIWLGFWALYNFILPKEKISITENQLRISIIHIFFSSLVLPFFVSNKIVFNTVIVVLVALSVSLIFLRKNSNIGRLSNTVFQMIWFSSVFFAITRESVVVTALVFGLTHLPILFIKHLDIRGRMLLLMASFIGGYLLALIIGAFIFPIALPLSCTVHMAFYILLRPIDKKYRLHIIY